MPDCSPHGFVHHLIIHRKIDYFELPLRETVRTHDLSGIKETSNFCSLGEAGQSLVPVSLSHLASQGAAGLCATTIDGTQTRKA